MFHSQIRRITLTLITSFFCYYSIPSYAFPFRVVLDPGHGGIDEGTVYEEGPTRIAEKEITLKLAHLVAKHLQARGFSVTLTRTDDKEVPLPARTALANKLQADAFISIHMNSAGGHKSNDAQGIETYILNNATDASSRRLAHLENSVITSQPMNTPEQFDVALILKDLRLDANLAESKRLACFVQTQLVTATSDAKMRIRRNRGVKQALFHVLLGADMPSILVEAGFLKSSQDRSYVLSPKGQLRISHAIANAISRFRNQKLNGKNLTPLRNCKLN